MEGLSDSDAMKKRMEEAFADDLAERLEIAAEMAGVTGNERHDLLKAAALRIRMDAQAWEHGNPTEVSKRLLEFANTHEIDGLEQVQAGDSGEVAWAYSRGVRDGIMLAAAEVARAEL